MTQSIHQTDIAIIGAGPAGLFAAFECGLLKMKSHVIDALSAVGGQCVALYPEKPIYDIPGYPSIESCVLVEKLAEQAGTMQPVYHLGQQVTELTRIEGGWRLTTSTETVIEAKAVIVAAGVGAFGPNRPPLEGLEEYEDRCIHYFVKSRADFAGKKVLIAGGGDSAVDWALSLSEIAQSVAIVHRRNKFRAAPESAERLDRLAAEGKIQVVTPYQLAGLEGEGGKLTAVKVATLDGEEKIIEADQMLAFFGLKNEIGPVKNWGLELVGNQIKIDPASNATNLPGVFAIGDIASYPGKLKLILSAFAEAARAAHSAFAVAFPDEAMHFEHSSSKK
ncbi:MAG: NAD(P)/FAD-dependent oxidoreductase [Pseudomonadota bacterium]|nr:NAD(P)/FAD-dependent oxidoreductase [Pseudomonadota bacterium]